MPAPSLIRPIGRLLPRLPSMPPALAFAVVLNALAWPLLKMRGMEGMVGRRYCIHVTDLNLRVRFGLNPEGFVAQPDGPSDLTVRASSRDFLQLVLRREDPDTLFFSRRLVMEGDTELGLQVKNTLDAIDPEEGLALLPPLPAGLVRTWLASAAA